MLLLIDQLRYIAMLLKSVTVVVKKLEGVLNFHCTAMFL